MKFDLSSLLLKSFILLLLTGSFSSCGGRPARKKMPELTDLNGLEGLPGRVPENGAVGATAASPFIFGDTLLSTGGIRSRFLSIALPDPAGDSLAMNLVNSYKPLASVFLTQWAGQEQKGVLIDLRENAVGTGYERSGMGQIGAGNAGAAIHRADYLVDAPSAFSLRLVLLWDAASASRADWCLETLGSLSSIHYTATGSSEQPGKAFRQDCFQPMEPCLDCQ